MATNHITSLDAAMTLWFHIVADCRGASEFNRWAKAKSRLACLIKKWKSCCYF